jgi:2-keto-3-deoxy-6-phosphogluconate aldolase
MARFKIIRSKQFNKPSSEVPKSVRSFMENGFLAIEFTWKTPRPARR